MTLNVLMFPSYVEKEDFFELCPKLCEELKRHRGIELRFHHWNGFVDNLPRRRRAIIFSSYSHDLTPLPLRAYCDERGHLLVENERNIDVRGGTVGDTIAKRFDAFLSAINPRMRTHELAEPEPSPVC